MPTRVTGGVDFRLATATFRGNQNLEASGFLVANTVLGPASGENVSYGGRIGYPNDRVGRQLSVHGSADEHDPRSASSSAGISAATTRSFATTRGRTQHPYIRRFSFGGDTDCLHRSRRIAR